MHFFVNATPKPQPRPRATKIGNHARVYNPKDADDWKTAVMAAAREAMNGAEALTGPLRVDICFYLPRPKGHYGTGRNAGKLKDSAPLWCDKKPDIDNLTKSTVDALTDIGLWHDDSQIVEQALSKTYAADPTGVGADFTIERMDDNG